ncbi:hypothetical protein TrCOL_g10931 [Triparma columacea]|uniref:Uncharacterized protein n=1 Tax=Triparma columacea TaxID=722753 RepID=A0A9W7G170_9STRA|nr:hypothetical protein TrCOL_g10931 [Triparma columacea]
MSLSCIKVLDLTRVLAGPYCTQLLSDLGCVIHKIEHPHHGDMTRSWGPPFVSPTSGVGKGRDLTTYFTSVNRNKKSVAMDLAKPSTRKAFETLVRGSDVIVHNYLPETSSKLGLTYSSISKINPSIIYASLTGYGTSGPFSNRSGYDAVTSGMYGLTDATGNNLDAVGVKAGVAVTDVVAGLILGQGILAKLYERDALGGRGGGVDDDFDGRVEGSLMAAHQSMLVNRASSEINSEGGGGRARYGNEHESIVPYQVFECGGGGHVVVGVGNDGQFKDFVGRVGLDVEELERETGKKFGRNEDRVENRAVLIPAIERKLMEKGRDEWCGEWEDAGFAFGPVRSIKEGFSCPQSVAQEMVVDLEGVKVVNHPLKHSGVLDVAEWTRPPFRGEHTEMVLSEFAGVREEEIRRMEREGDIEIWREEEV